MRDRSQANFESNGLAASVVKLLKDGGASVFNFGLAPDLANQYPYVAEFEKVVGAIQLVIRSV